MSSSTKRLRCRTLASPGRSLSSDCSNSLATSSSEPGLMRAMMQPRWTPSAILRGLLQALLDDAHLLLGALVHVLLGGRIVRGGVPLHREVLDPAHLGAAVLLLEVPLDVHVLEGAGLDPA